MAKSCKVVTTKNLIFKCFCRNSTSGCKFTTRQSSYYFGGDIHTSQQRVSHATFQTITRNVVSCDFELEINFPVLYRYFFDSDRDFSPRFSPSPGRWRRLSWRRLSWRPWSCWSRALESARRSRTATSRPCRWRTPTPPAEADTGVRGQASRVTASSRRTLEK